MVKSASGKSGYRSFTVVGASKHGGCKTKFHGGLYRSKNAESAAKKAFKQLCRVKRIKGRCALVLTLRETTQGSSKKEYTYKLVREKLAKPVIRLEGTPNEFVIEYRSVAKAMNKPSDCKKPGQTRGRMKKRTAKKNRKSANNVRRNRKRNSMRRRR